MRNSAFVGFYYKNTINDYIRGTKLIGMKHSAHVDVTGFNQWRTQEFCSGGGEVQQIQLRTEDRENGDLGAVAL